MQNSIAQFLNRFPDIFVVLGVPLGGLALGLLVKTVVFSLLRTYDQREDSLLARSVVTHLRATSTFFFPVLALSLLLPLLPLPPRPFEVLRRLVEFALNKGFKLG